MRPTGETGSRAPDDEARLAWIMGSSRSGSTWLLRMLADLDPIVGIDDPHLGHHLGVWRPLSLAWAAAPEAPELSTLDQVKRNEDDYFFADRYRDAWMPALRELIRARFKSQIPAERQRSQRTVLVVKEPAGQAAPTLFELFPRSRLVFLLRDGRDVADSWLDGYRHGSWAIEEGAFAATASGRVALAAWLGSVWAYRTRTVADVFPRLDEDQRILVRYEALLEDTAGELARICSTLGIEAPAEMLEEIADRHSYDQVAPGQRGPLRPVRSAEPGRWRRRPRAERRAMHATMAPELTRWGYLPERPARPARRAA